jgi:hypothetical protein
MDNKISNEMIRYKLNKDKYNTRAKKYFKEYYYPLKRDEILQKAKEKRLLNKESYEPHIKKVEKTKNISLIVSFD